MQLMRKRPRCRIRSTRLENSQVENEAGANKVAKDIVSDLSSQLVDIYGQHFRQPLYSSEECGDK